MDEVRCQIRVVTLLAILPQVWTSPGRKNVNTNDMADDFASDILARLVARTSDVSSRASRSSGSLDYATLGKQSHLATVPASGRVSYRPSLIREGSVRQSAANTCRLAPLHALPQPGAAFSHRSLRSPLGRRVDVILPGKLRGQSTSARLVLAEQAQQHALWAVAGESSGHAVIMRNKGDRLGELGYHLALALQAQGLKVTMLQESTMMNNFDSNEKLAGSTNIVWVDPSDLAEFTRGASAAIKDGPPITHIFDNFSNNPKEIAPLLALAKASHEFKLYSFVSSMGMHTKTGELSEDGSIKGSPDGQRQVEMKLDEELPGKWASFRPQYVYGRYTNKRGYLDWFREQPINLAHCEDVAALVSSVVGKEEAAGGEVFNCGTSDQVTTQAVCEAIEEKDRSGDQKIRATVTDPIVSLSTTWRQVSSSFAST